ncbi:glutathione S-transferase family protein [Azospirillum sp. TSO22-1]|uniref:glutathione S-transferase family protein n=1 Tax=Azospirillum sp. TSO22-1 TaxID=716789 RepID=UPI000D60D8C9|nr:glutathione S-transferase family protein [Azospirillum sp. TSO22-1]PWC55583.1 glutathione S-transferase [Azospirillum sp. TSO22-1]
MSRELVFYTNPWSRGRVARWMLEEVGQPYRTEILEYGTTMKAPEYLAINPMGKVPAIRHGDTVVTENAAICAYLADAFPEAGLAPPSGDPRRGSYYRWLFFAAGPFDSAVTGKALGVEVPPEKKVMVSYGCMNDVLNTLEVAVSCDAFLTGDQFTAADLFVGSMLGWTMGFGIIDKRPAFEAYVARCMTRPAAARAKEIDDALVPADRRPPAGS